MSVKECACRVSCISYRRARCRGDPNRGEAVAVVDLIGQAHVPSQEAAGAWSPDSRPIAARRHLCDRIALKIRDSAATATCPAHYHRPPIAPNPTGIHAAPITILAFWSAAPETPPDHPETTPPAHRQAMTPCKTTRDPPANSPSRQPMADPSFAPHPREAGAMAVPYGTNAPARKARPCVAYHS
ncbi:Uncharacterised protein [Mycobacteroides abscessus subsp. massiliense]|nr:Uncharacterised protein [Mycobacteroides abscessus subsp. massiliense]